jgi:hypothetical protein
MINRRTDLKNTKNVLKEVADFTLMVVLTDHYAPLWQTKG